MEVSSWKVLQPIPVISAPRFDRVRIGALAVYRDKYSYHHGQVMLVNWRL